MAHIIKQYDIEILQQTIKDLSHVRIELLDPNDKIIEVLQGELISDNYTIDADSAVRTTYNCSLYVKDKSYFVGENNKIWLDKRIRPYISIVHQRSGDVVHYLVGTFVMSEGNYVYNETTHELSLSCSDLMCLINGELGGEITDSSMTIEANLNARDTIIYLLEEAGITKYIVNDVDFVLPYEIEIKAGDTYYNIIDTILKLYNGYEFFVNQDGTFVIQYIPTTENENIQINDEILAPLVISEQMNTSLKEIYNHIIVYGDEIEIDRFSMNSTYSESTYNVTMDQCAEYLQNTTYGFKIPVTNSGNDYININSIGAKKIIVQDDVNIRQGQLIQNDIGVFRYRQLTDDFIYLGIDQVKGEAEDTNPNSPYSIQSLGRRISHIADGYDKIPNVEAATLAAKVELWKSTNRQNSITLETMVIPFLNVNEKISYTSKSIGQQYLYITKRISGSTTTGLNTIEMIRYYPEYPDIF